MALAVCLAEYEMLDGSRKTLVRQIGDGSIIKRFDKTPPPRDQEDIVCPHFLELKWAIGCPFSCAWCYLQGTLRFLPEGKEPILKLSKGSYDVNPYEKIARHVRAFFRAKLPEQVHEVLNTGELADSLMHEAVERPFSKFIIPLFEEQKEHKVLFLTKSSYVRNLLEIEAHDQTIVSFSLNSYRVAARWEGAPPPKERIKAAAKLFRAGYSVRIRIDPIVPWPESWKEDYIRLIDDLLEELYPERITIGSLRGLQSTINFAKDRSWVKFLGERSKWGKRIAFSGRYQAFKLLIGRLEERHGYSNIALCKEPVGMWEALGLDWRKCRCNCIW